MPSQQAIKKSLSPEILLGQSFCDNEYESMRFTLPSLLILSEALKKLDFRSLLV